MVAEDLDGVWCFWAPSLRLPLACIRKVTITSAHKLQFRIETYVDGTHVFRAPPRPGALHYWVATLQELHGNAMWVRPPPAWCGIWAAACLQKHWRGRIVRRKAALAREKGPGAQGQADAVHHGASGQTTASCRRLGSAGRDAPGLVQRLGPPLAGAEVAAAASDRAPPSIPLQAFAADPATPSGGKETARKEAKEKALAAAKAKMVFEGEESAPPVQAPRPAPSGGGAPARSPYLQEYHVQKSGQSEKRDQPQQGGQGEKRSRPSGGFYLLHYIERQCERSGAPPAVKVPPPKSIFTKATMAAIEAAGPSKSEPSHEPAPSKFMNFDPTFLDPSDGPLRAAADPASELKALFTVQRPNLPEPPPRSSDSLGVFDRKFAFSSTQSLPSPPPSPPPLAQPIHSSLTPTPACGIATKLSRLSIGDASEKAALQRAWSSPVPARVLLEEKMFVKMGGVLSVPSLLRLVTTSADPAAHDPWDTHIEYTSERGLLSVPCHSIRAIRMSRRSKRGFELDYTERSGLRTRLRFHAESKTQAQRLRKAFEPLPQTLLSGPPQGVPPFLVRKVPKSKGLDELAEFLPERRPLNSAREPGGVGGAPLPLHMHVHSQPRWPLLYAADRMSVGAASGLARAPRGFGRLAHSNPLLGWGYLPQERRLQLATLPPYTAKDEAAYHKLLRAQRGEQGRADDLSPASAKTSSPSKGAAAGTAAQRTPSTIGAKQPDPAAATKLLGKGGAKPDATAAPSPDATAAAAKLLGKGGTTPDASAAQLEAAAAAAKLFGKGGAKPDPTVAPEDSFSKTFGKGDAKPDAASTAAKLFGKGGAKTDAAGAPAVAANPFAARGAWAKAGTKVILETSPAKRDLGSIARIASLVAKSEMAQPGELRDGYGRRISDSVIAMGQTGFVPKSGSAAMDKLLAGTPSKAPQKSSPSGNNSPPPRTSQSNRADDKRLMAQKAEQQTSTTLRKASPSPRPKSPAPRTPSGQLTRAEKEKRAAFTPKLAPSSAPPRGPPPAPPLPPPNLVLTPPPPGADRPVAQGWLQLTNRPTDDDGQVGDDAFDPANPPWRPKNKNKVSSMTMGLRPSESGISTALAVAAASASDALVSTVSQIMQRGSVAGGVWLWCVLGGRRLRCYHCLEDYYEREPAAINIQMSTAIVNQQAGKRGSTLLSISVPAPATNYERRGSSHIFAAPTVTDLHRWATALEAAPLADTFMLSAQPSDAAAHLRLWDDRPTRSADSTSDKPKRSLASALGGSRDSANASSPSPPLSTTLSELPENQLGDTGLAALAQAPRKPRSTSPPPPPIDLPPPPPATAQLQESAAAAAFAEGQLLKNGKSPKPPPPPATPQSRESAAAAAFVEGQPPPPPATPQSRESAAAAAFVEGQLLKNGKSPKPPQPPDGVGPNGDLFDGPPPPSPPDVQSKSKIKKKQKVQDPLSTMERMRIEWMSATASELAELVHEPSPLGRRALANEPSPVVTRERAASTPRRPTSPLVTGRPASPVIEYAYASEVEHAFHSGLTPGTVKKPRTRVAVRRTKQVHSAACPHSQPARTRRTRYLGPILRPTGSGRSPRRPHPGQG